MQVTVEIRVEPKPRAHRPIVFGFVWAGAATAPQRKTHRVRPFSTVVSSSGFPVNRHHVSNSGPNALFVTDHRDQIARPAAAQHSNQLRQEARREGLSPNIQIDVSPHRNACILH